MNRSGIGIFLIASACAIAAEPVATISHKEALEKVRAAVASVCGAGRAFACSIAKDSRPQRCALEYVVLLPIEPGEAVAKGFWVGLDVRGRIVSVERKREELCPSA